MGHAGPDGLETYMAWNEPGGNKPKDPWGGGGRDDLFAQIRRGSALKHVDRSKPPKPTR